MSSELGRNNVSVATTGLLLLGLGPSVIDQQRPSRSPIMTTSVPLPYIPSPFRAADNEEQPDEEFGTNPWVRNSMLILDSLFLIVEDVEPWSGDSYFEGGALQYSDIAEVRDVLDNPVNYSDPVVRLYDEGRSALMCLELFTLLITHPQTADAILHLFFVRLPHRHQLFNQVLKCPKSSFLRFNISTDVTNALGHLPASSPSHHEINFLILGTTDRQ